MRHIIELSPEEESNLNELARASGASPEQVLRLLLRAVADAPIQDAQWVQSLRRALDHLADDLPVRRTPDVMGGDACIRNTRIAIWTLVDYKRQGMTDAQLLEAFPTLNVADLAVAWDYYASHSEEVDNQRRRHEDAA